MITREITTKGDYRYFYEETTETGSTSHFNLGSSTDYVGHITMNGPLPGWRDIIRNGDNATTPLEGTAYEFENVPCNLRYGVADALNPSSYRRTIVISGSLFTLSLPTFTGSANLPQMADNLALTRFYSRLASQSSSFKGMVFTGELRESLQMIRHPARALRDGLDHYLAALRKGGRKMTRSKRPSFIRRTWLEYAFGWRPLISDIDQAIQQFYQSQWVRPIFTMVTGQAELREADKPTLLQLNGGYSHFIRYEHNMDIVSSCRYYGILDSKGNGVADAHSYGFAPWEFVPTVYELIPYSFLVDYFTNLGSIVNSWSYRFIGPRWASKGQKSQQRAFISNARLDYDGLGAPGQYTEFRSGSPGTSVLSKTTLKRTSGVALELPSFEVKVPGMQSLKWVNMAALSANSRRTSSVLQGP